MPMRTSFIFAELVAVSRIGAPIRIVKKERSVVVATGDRFTMMETYCRHQDTTSMHRRARSHRTPGKSGCSAFPTHPPQKASVTQLFSIITRLLVLEIHRPSAVGIIGAAAL